MVDEMRGPGAGRRSRPTHPPYPPARVQSRGAEAALDFPANARYPALAAGPNVHVPQELRTEERALVALPTQGDTRAGPPSATTAGRASYQARHGAPRGA